MIGIKLAVWFMKKNLLNSIKRQWKIYLVIIAIIGGVFALSYFLGSDLEDVTEEVVTQDEEYILDTELDLVIDDDGVQYDIGNLLLSGIVFFVIWIFFVISMVKGAKNGVSFFTMPDVHFLFPAPIKPQSVLLFKMAIQIGAVLLGSLYILIQIPDLVDSGIITLPGALLICGGYVYLAFFTNVLSVFFYIFFSTRDRLKNFVARYGLLLLALPILVPAFMYFVLDFGIYDLVRLAFPFSGANLVPFFGWLTAYTLAAASGNYLMCFVYMLLTIALSALIIYITWQMECDFYEDALSGAQTLADAGQQLKTVAAGGAKHDVKHSKIMEKIWEKRRNKELSFEGYQGASVFFAKVILNRKRMHALNGLWSATASLYFFICAGCIVFLRIVSGEMDPLVLTLLPTCICLVIMFIRSFANPLEEDLSHNFIYLIPESPRALLNWGMGGQVLDGAMDLLLATIALGIGSLNIWYGILCGLLMLSMHIFFGMTALMVNLIISSYLPMILSRILQFFIRLLPFIPVLVVLLIGLFIGNAYISFIGVILINLIFSILIYIPCPYFLHRGKR